MNFLNLLIIILLIVAHICAYAANAANSTVNSSEQWDEGSNNGTAEMASDESDEGSFERSKNGTAEMASDGSDEGSDEKTGGSEGESFEKSNEESAERSTNWSDEGKGERSDERSDDASDEKKTMTGRRRNRSYLTYESLIRIVKMMSQQAQAAFQRVGMDLSSVEGEEYAGWFGGEDRSGSGEQGEGMEGSSEKGEGWNDDEDERFNDEEDDQENDGEEELESENDDEDEGHEGENEDGEEENENQDDEVDRAEEEDEEFPRFEQNFEPVPNYILEQIPPFVIGNFTLMDFLMLFGFADLTPKVAGYYLSSLDNGVFLEVMAYFPMQPGFAPLAIKTVMMEAAIRHLGPVSEWTPQTASQLNYAVCGLNRHHLAETSAETFRQVLGPIRECQEMGHLDVRLADDVIRAAEAHWGSVNTWSFEYFDLLKPFFKNLHPSQMEHISPEMIMSHLSFFGSQELPRNLGRLIINKLRSSPNWTWSEEQVASLKLLSKHLTMREFKRIPTSANGSMPTEIIEEMKGAVHGKRQTKQLVKMMTKSYGDSSTWDVETLRSIGSVARGLDVEQLDHIPDSSVREAISDIADSDFSPKQRHVIMKKYLRAKATNGSEALTGDDLKDLRGLVTDISSETFSHMKPADIRGAVGVLAENAKKMKPTQKRQIIKTLINSTEGISDALTDLGDIAQELPLRVLDSPEVVEALFSTEDSDDDTGVMNVGKMHWTPRQSTKLIKKYMQGEDMEEMTQTTITQLGTLVTGFQCSDIIALPGDNVVGLISTMMDQDGWKKKQLRCSAEWLREVSSTSDVVFTTHLEESEIDALTGHILRHLSIQELMNIPHEICERTIALIGMEEDVIELRRAKRQEIVELALECLGEDEAITGDTMSLDHMTELGHLRCDLSAETLGSVSVETLSDFVYDLQQCCMDEEQLAVMRTRILEIKGSPETWTSDDLLDVGLLIGSLNEEEIEKIDEARFSDVVEDVVETMQSVMKKREHYCEHDMTEVDRAAFSDGLVRLAGKLKDSLVAAAQEEAEETRRRKRSFTYSPTCTEIESLGQANVGWSVEELLAMSSETLDDCMYALGEVEGLSAEQSQAIMQRVKATWGEASEIDPENIAQMGRIAGQFTVKEISELDLPDVDTVWSIAQYDVWSPEQLSTGINHILDTLAVAIEDMDSIALTGLSNFLCGMTASELSTISSSAYIDAAASIGQLTTCNAEQWSSLKDLAVEEYGSIDTWTVDIYMELGGVVAGFTEAELRTITNDTIAGVAPHALGLISPDDIVNGFGSSVIMAFDSDQIAALSEDQTADMSDEQLYAMAVAVYGEEEIPSEFLEARTTMSTPTPEVAPMDDGTKGSGSGVVLYSFIVMLSCLAASYSV